MPPYALSDVCRVLGVTEDDLTNWARRGLMGLVSFGRGHERRVESAEVIRAAIIKRCQDLGISPSRSAEWATEADLLMATYAVGQKLTQIVIRRYENGDELVSPNDHLMKKKAPPGASTTLTIDLELILDKIRTELKEAS